MMIFVIVPLLLVIYFSLTTVEGENTNFSLVNYQKFFEPVYIKVLLRSINLALISTVFCFVLGYPLAMFLSGKEMSRKNFIILLFVLPHVDEFFAPHLCLEGLLL
jgi:spermidine/putrescine transport system permease protein